MSSGSISSLKFLVRSRIFLRFSPREAWPCPCPCYFSSSLLILFSAMFRFSSNSDFSLRKCYYSALYSSFSLTIASCASFNFSTNLKRSLSAFSSLSSSYCLLCFKASLSTYTESSSSPLIRYSASYCFNCSISSCKREMLYPSDFGSDIGFDVFFAPFSGVFGSSPELSNLSFVLSWLISP